MARHAREFLNRCCASTAVLESILLAQGPKIFFRQHRSISEVGAEARNVRYSSVCGHRGAPLKETTSSRQPMSFARSRAQDCQACMSTDSPANSARSSQLASSKTSKSKIPGSLVKANRPISHAAHIFLCFKRQRHDHEIVYRISRLHWRACHNSRGNCEGGSCSGPSG